MRRRVTVERRPGEADGEGGIERRADGGRHGASMRCRRGSAKGRAAALRGCRIETGEHERTTMLLAVAIRVAGRGRPEPEAIVIAAVALTGCGGNADPGRCSVRTAAAALVVANSASRWRSFSSPASQCDGWRAPDSGPSTPHRQPKRREAPGWGCVRFRGAVVPEVVQRCYRGRPATLSVRPASP